MSEHAITRRSFLAGSAGAVALTAAAGYVSFDAWEQAHADDGAQGGETKTVHSLCNACSSKCGFTAYVVDGRLTKLIGDEDHPYAQGKLCARGYGYSQIAYSKDRLTDPLKKNDKGAFEAISWDQAYSEIAEKVKAIIADKGPQALAMVQDPRPSGKYYTKRFMNALGSANVYTHGAACNLSKESGFTQAIGAASYASDMENSKMTMFIGRSYADAIRPSSVAELQRAHENGAHIVLVDPRCNNSIAFADEWVPINPGTDLAFLLAMSNVLVTRGLYDKQYVADNAVGFEDWAASLADCTPEWAEKITGIPATTIARLAVEFAEAAPAASIEPSWRGAFGCSYANSGETARAVCLFNTLLGCWNQEGGAIFTPSVSAGDVDKEKFPSVPKPENKIAGTEEYPLALTSMGTNLFAAEQAKNGDIKGMFFYNSNMAAGYSNTAYLADALSQLDLIVVVDVQMSETALLADYVLPEMCIRDSRRAERDARVVAASATPVRTATRAVGVPRILRTEEEPESEGAATAKGAEEPRQPERSSEASEELRHPERSAEGAESKDPERRDSAQDAETPADPPCVPCDDIVALIGKHSYYLYSTERMTDAYARWSFLASEDDRVLTFVECVRDESRKYPRPMEASSLSNEPFNLSADEIDELWRTVRDSGAYPDLDTVAASNGDVYYFSTEYLTPAYAKSLAEWNSVERDMFL